MPGLQRHRRAARRQGADGPELGPGPSAQPGTRRPRRSGRRPRLRPLRPGPAGQRGRGQVIDRRRFLLLSGGAGAGLLLAACSTSSTQGGIDQPSVAPADHLEGDLAVAALLASLENLLVSVYKEGLDKADKIGPIPPATMAALEAAMNQHKEHVNAWNGIITGTGKPGIKGVDL